MAVSRRRFLLGGAGLGAVTALGGALQGCGSTTEISPGALTVWFWTGSISPDLLKKVGPATNTTVVAQLIGGDFKSKLLTSMAGRAYVPDVTGINSDIGTYFPDADQFHDLHDLGVESLKSQYLGWKWQQGVTPNGRMIGFPMDTGPTALYYRKDMLEKAGLSGRPADVKKTFDSWGDFVDRGAEVAKKLPGTYLAPSLLDIYSRMMNASPQQYVDQDNRFIGDQSHVRTAWDLAVKVKKMGLSAGITGGPQWNALMANGKIFAFVSAVWEANYLAPAAQSSSGKWRVCQAPGEPGNFGGSFLAIPRFCEHPEEAVKVITWLESAKNQAQSYQDVNLFPSTPASYANPVMRKPNPFFGGQVTVDVFGPAAKRVRPAYFGPYQTIIDNIFTGQLTDVDSAGKNPEQAWRDAISQSLRALKHAGVA